TTIIASNCLDLDARTLEINWVDQTTVPNRTFVCLGHFLGRHPSLYYDIITLLGVVRHQLCDYIARLRYDPRGCHGHHPAGLRTPRFNAVQVSFRAVSLGVMLYAETGNLGINGSRDIPLCSFNLCPLFLRGTDDIERTPRQHAGDRI